MELTFPFVEVADLIANMKAQAAPEQPTEPNP